ncbi:MAG: hypothetical protein WC228_04715, partial [Candidatus Cloacimonadaceae bacterium]
NYHLFEGFTVAINNFLGASVFHFFLLIFSPEFSGHHTLASGLWSLAFKPAAGWRFPKTRIFSLTKSADW